MILKLVDEAVAGGCSQEAACARIGISERTIQRWRSSSEDDDRHGPKTRPANALSEQERARVLEIANTPEFRELSPKQIVPQLADRGEYVASESTMYRILRDEEQVAHRGRARPPTSHRPDEHVATGPNQVLSWDITYLRAALAGTFFYLYLVLDIWSRKIVGWEVHKSESPDLAADLALKTCAELGVDPAGIVLHSDNGGPMKGATMLATLERLGIVASFSRPHVSDDNAYSEALFRTLKYRPWYPSRPFETVEQARAWVAEFVLWYNSTHRHSAIRYVTPQERHSGREVELLENRRRVYEQARNRRPERWTGSLRNWTPVGDVYLNPKPRAKEVVQLNLQPHQTIANAA
jgi:transposase InsO family protein